MKTTNGAHKLIGSKVSLSPEAHRFAVGSTIGVVIAAANTVSGWQDGGQVKVRWNDGEESWEPIAGLRDMFGGYLSA